MRKLVLATAIILLASSAFAGPRGLSAPQPAEPQRPFRQAEVTVLPAPGEQPAAVAAEPAPLTDGQRLEEAGEVKSDATPEAKQVEAMPVESKPVKAQAPLQAQPAPRPAEAQAPVQTQPAQKPAKKRVAKKRESDEQKARRIAARFGISW